MFPSCIQLVKTIVLVVVLGYLLALDSSEARSLEDQQDEISNYGDQENLQRTEQQLVAAAAAAAGQIPMTNTGDNQNLDRSDSDDDDDDDDRIQQVQPDQQYLHQQPQQLMNNQVQTAAAGSDLYQTDQSYQPPYQPPTQDLRTAASKHYGHHKHGAKGWLDMGAWTGKKGAFGWYDKHPVGGKGRK
jgi:hypothetical protein